MRAASLPAFPHLAPWYRIVEDDGRIVLEYGQRVVVLEGRAAERFLPVLLPLLDGTRSVDEIVRAVGEPARPAVENALAELAARGVLGEGPPLSEDVAGPVAGTVQLLASLLPPERPLALTADELAAVTIAVLGDGELGVEIGRLLRHSGVRVEHLCRIEKGMPVAVCAPSSSELPLLGEWNSQALEAVTPWLQVLPFDGRYAAVGPLFLPGETCCHECFQLRRAANLEYGTDLALLQRTPARYPTAPALDAALSGIAALLLLGWLLRGDHHLPACFYALELGPPLALSAHHVHRVPRCPACSGLARTAAPLPWHKEIPHDRV